MSVSEMSLRLSIEGLSGEGMLDKFDYKATEEVPTNFPEWATVLTNIPLLITWKWYTWPHI